MKSPTLLRTCRRPTVRSWLGAVLVALLLVAEVFAVSHPLDLAAHANGEPCNVCLSLASFGSGAVAHAAELGVDTTLPTFVAVGDEPFLLSAVPARQLARGPPVTS